MSARPPTIRTCILGTCASRLTLLAQGRSIKSVAGELGVSRAAIREWRVGPPYSLQDQCPVDTPGRLSTACYAALLGYYLGDGCLSRARSTFSLRVSCDEKYPVIIEDVTQLIRDVRRRRPVSHVRAPGCIVVCAYWSHWPCVFPQHGFGRKHERALSLRSWQVRAVHDHPGAFLRGLFHSDGCRVRNWATQQVAGETKRYEYARWQFVNHSTDIQRFCTEALDLLEIPWRQSSWKTISVSRRDAVARLDEIIGPKG